MTKAAAFKEVDVRRAIKGAESAGLTVSGFEITREGTIRVLTGAAAPSPSLSEADRWFAANGED